MAGAGYPAVGPTALIRPLSPACEALRILEHRLEGELGGTEQ
jgi:hypothetical protein